MLCLEQVSFGYPGQAIPVLDSIELSLASGSFTFLTGASGSGKSTLLRLMYGALRPNQGRVLLGHDGILAPPRRSRRQIGIVLQSLGLLPDRSAFGNVAFTLEIAGFSPSKVRSLAQAALAAVGLDHKAHVLPRKLSGGEQQRVAVARAVAHRPKFLFCDEPTGDLDPDNARQVMLLLRDLTRQLGCTTVVATHAADLVNALEEPVFHVRQGRLEAVGTRYPVSQEVTAHAGL